MHEKLAPDVNAGTPSPPLSAVLPAPGEDCGTYLNASIRPNRDRSLVRIGIGSAAPGSCFTIVASDPHAYFTDALTVGWMRPLVARWSARAKLLDV